MEHVPLYRDKDKPRLSILEPSAGTGNLARRLAIAEYDRVRYGHYVDCVEVQADLANALTREKLYRRVMTRDFLQIAPVPEYDLVVMNPPFDLERDIDHVMHALKFLKPDGELHAIMSAGTEFRETTKAIAFRKVVESMRGRFSDLPPGSFSEVGTNVNTCILRLRKDGKHRYW
jgi:16S rRNA G1207 methylase RsmC